MICRRQSNGKILLGHYRHQRRHFAGDECLYHQPVTATRRKTRYRPPRAAASELHFIFMAFPSGTRPTNQLWLLAYVSKADVLNANKRAADMLRSSRAMRWAKQHPVCKFVAAQRANERRLITFAKTSFGSTCAPETIG
jgi:hypothetical protein